MAVVELNDPAAFDPSAFDEFLAAQPDLGTKWAPRYVRVVDRLPVGATNKLDKQALRHQSWRVDDRVYWRATRREPLTLMTADDAAGLDQAIAVHRPAKSPG
jgi:fatty-acyl-CoA synthase